MRDDTIQTTFLGFLGYVWSRRWVIIILTAGTLLAEHVGLLRSFETTAFDTWLRINLPIKPRFVRVVAITDADYERIFNRQSPLDRQKLLNIIDNIALAHPAVIAVDIDTSDKFWDPDAKSSEDRKFREDLEKTLSKTSIVWGQNFQQKDSVQPNEVLGGRKLRQDETDKTGIAASITDWDGVVRRYRRVIETTGGKKYSLPWVAVKVAVNKLKGPHKPSEIEPSDISQKTIEAANGKPGDKPITLPFAADRYDFGEYSASQVKDFAHEPGWQKLGPLTKKVVLLGQEHPATRDEYMTPVGPKSGLRIMAQAVESELQGLGIRPVAEWIMLLFDLIGAVAILAFQYCWRPRTAFWASVTASPVIALFGSYFAFSTLSYWANFIPVFFGVLLHELHDHVKNH